MCLCESDSNGCSRKNTFVPMCRAEVCRIIRVCIVNKIKWKLKWAKAMQCRIRAQRPVRRLCCWFVLGHVCIPRQSANNWVVSVCCMGNCIHQYDNAPNGMIARASFLNFSSSSQSRSTRTQLHSLNLPTKATYIQILQMGKSSRIHTKISYFQPRQQSNRNLKADNNVDAFCLAKAHVFRFFINLNSDTHLFIRMIYNNSGKYTQILFVEYLNDAHKIYIFELNGAVQSINCRYLLLVFVLFFCFVKISSI